MRNIILKTQFDGTDFCGWQSQINGRAVQDILRKAIHDLTGEDVNLVGCSRTDAGVHAMEHVSNFLTESNVPADRFTYALNPFLPDDISVIHSEETDIGFNARFCAKGKHYRYLIQTGEARKAIWNRYSYYEYRKIDMDKMHMATEMFVGEHDFAGFMAAGGTVKTTVRTIYSCELSRMNEDVLAIDIEGNGFLYNMVRIIAGTVLSVGEGFISLEDLPGIIESCDRKKAGRTLPANGLILCKVFY